MQKHLISWLVAVIVLVAGSITVADDKTPSGTIVIDETQVMALIGGSMGGGTLLLKDDSHSFKVGGLKLGGVGVHNIHITGTVYHLNDVKDFPGTYFAAEAGVTIVKGVGGMWMENSKGVTLHLKSKAEGLALGMGIEGLKITMR